MQDEASAETLYSLTPELDEEIDETIRQELVQKARNFHDQWKRLQSSQFFSHEEFYLVSVKFLQRWKVYVGYEQSIYGKSTQGKYFGSGKLPIINENIVESINKFSLILPNQYSHLRVVLKPGLQEKKDYIFATKQMWEVLIRGLNPDQYLQINRKVVETQEGKKVQLYYQQLTIIPISNTILKDIEYEKRSALLFFSVQFSHYATIETLQNAIKKQIAEDKLPYQHSYKISRNLEVKIWLTAENIQKQILFNTLLQGCKANSTFSYRLYFEGQRLNEQKTLNECDILENSFLVLEFKEDKSDWIFFNKNNVLVSSCSNCRSIERLEYLCSCKFIAYCSKQCKLRDKTYHQGRCPNNAQSDQQEKELTLTPQSRRGIVGLRNLGNTCFMNSGLQCISHVVELTEYFLLNKYIQDINKDNPLGTKGQLCMAFAKMLKHLWYGNQSFFSPTQLKRAIGKFQPMFSGYNQHDSGELITYLLDGLHEDLNRVKEKPYVQSKDYDGRPDPIIAAESWKDFLIRNQSQIVDLMYGQYRSVVDCPNCQNHSIQFDPFCMCSLPIRHSTLKKLEVTYLQKHVFMHKLQVCFDKAWNWKMQDVANEVRKQINKPNAKLLFYVASYSTCEVINQSRKVNDIRSEFKYRTLYVRELGDEEQPDNSIKIMLGNSVCHSRYGDESYRNSLTPYRLYFFNPNITLKELHHKILSYYEPIQKFENYEENVINAQKQEQPLRLLAIASTRYSPCEYCDKKGCQGCQIPYRDDIPLASFVKNVEKDKAEFELFWRKNAKEVQNKFNEYSEGKKKSQQSSQTTFKKGEVTLQDCLKLFEQSETLGEDNAWYCPQCKDFVLARKQMQIYKAPKILILCLKRFKRKQYYQEKYNILVDFPLQNLDLSQYVINKSLPTHEINEIEAEASNNSPLLYDLFAISNHFGGTGGGHYTAFCKNSITGEWYDFDDSSVDLIKNKDNLVSENAYILFYRRKN